MTVVELPTNGTINDFLYTKENNNYLCCEQLNRRFYEIRDQRKFLSFQFLFFFIEIFFNKGNSDIRLRALLGMKAAWSRANAKKRKLTSFMYWQNNET